MSAILGLLVAYASATISAAPVDRTVTVGTDAANLFLFHPDDLKHREAAPSDWVYIDFACGREFREGNLIAFRTGGDGGFRVRLTDGDLTPSERAAAGNSYTFRYRARHGRIYVDGGNFVPGLDEYRKPEERIPEEHSVDLPNGNYEARVIDINRPDDEQAAARLPDYVVQFRKSRRMASIPVLSPVPPFIENMRPGHPVYDEPPSHLQFEEADPLPLDETCLALVSEPAYLLPQEGGYRQASQALFDEIRRRAKPREPSIRMVLLDSEVAPAVGTLVEADAQNDFDGPRAQIRVRAIRQVRVVEVTKRGDLLEAEVAPLTRPKSRVPAADLNAVKAEFTAFARSNAEYRRKQKYPDYEAERVEALTSPSVLTNILLARVPLDAARRQALLPLSDLGRIKGLRETMKAAK